MERNLTAHEPHAPLPCLCKGCLASAPAVASVEGLQFHRLEVRGGGRVLHAWIPEELKDEEERLRDSMERQLRRRYEETSRAMPSGSEPVPEASGPGLFGRLRRFFGV